MQRGYKNKAIGEEESEAKVETGVRVYSFPDYQISVEAESREEAEAKLQKILAERDSK